MAWTDDDERLYDMVDDERLDNLSEIEWASKIHIPVRDDTPDAQFIYVWQRLTPTMSKQVNIQQFIIM
jgi:hypothetical protein